MKKTVAIVVCALAAALCVALVGCGGNAKDADSEYLGTWKAGTASYSGLEFDASELFGDDFALVLETGGNAKLVMDGETTSGTWVENDNGFSLDDSGGELSFTKVETGVVTLDYEGITITFTKAS